MDHWSIFQIYVFSADQIHTIPDNLRYDVENLILKPSMDEVFISLPNHMSNVGTTGHGWEAFLFQEVTQRLR